MGRAVMTTRELAELAYACRAAQRAYFLNRTADRLDVAKRAERLLDDALEAILNPELFDDGQTREAGR